MMLNLLNTITIFCKRDFLNSKISANELCSVLEDRQQHTYMFLAVQFLIQSSTAEFNRVRLIEKSQTLSKVQKRHSYCI